MSPKTAIITGAGSGIGKQLALTLHQKGYHLCLTDLNYHSLEENFTQAIYDKPGTIILNKMDVRDKEAWEDLIIETIIAYGQIDYLFNVAGYILPAYIYKGKIEQIDRHIDINVKGTMYGCKHAAEFMVRQGHGHIINIASLAGVAPISGISAYSASKFAVRGFSLAIAQELQAKNVFVSVICPDVVDTPMMDLQLSYEEASLTFSGHKVLRTSEVVKSILEVMKNKKLEVMIPRQRGLLARFANLFPGLHNLMTSLLSKKGKQKAIKIKMKKFSLGSNTQKNNDYELKKPF